MPTTWKFVDSPVASPTVFLDMNNGSTWKTLGGSDNFKLPSPPLDRTFANNPMNDGALLSSAAYENRALTFTLELSGATEAARVAQLDALKAELAKPSNLLMYQSQLAANPVFFRTVRSDEYEVDNQFVPGQTWRVSCVVMAEPFAIGIRRDLASVIVTNDPASPGTVLNANTSFETDLSGWSGSGGTLTRTTAQFHAGVASATITPDGVAANALIVGTVVPVTAGKTYRAKGWLRCAVARSVNLNVNWFDSGNAYITTSSSAISVAANTWTFITGDFVAPAGAATGSIIPTVPGTPPATNILWADEIEFRSVPGVNPALFDITGIVGDSPTPAFVRLSGLGAGDTAILAQRTVNNPAALTAFAQAESGTMGTDTSTWSNAAMSGGSGTSTTFTTSTSLVTRVTVTVPTASSSAALRGRYKVWARVHTGGTSADYVIRWVQNPGAGMDVVNGPSTTYHANTVWQMLDLGTIDFPSMQAPPTIGYSALAPGFATASLAIQASRANGLDNLDMDYIYLMPADERSCQVNQVTAASFLVLDGPNDMTYGMAAATTAFGATRTVDNAGGLTPRFGGLPQLVPGVTNRWHLLIEKGVVTATTTADVSYWPRWREVATS